MERAEKGARRGEIDWYRGRLKYRVGGLLNGGDDLTAILSPMDRQRPA